MPSYEFECRHCGSFAVFRSMEKRNAHCSCPKCGREAFRILASAPALSILTTASRKAHAMNEQASHEPKTTDEYRASKHPVGCACCSSSRSRATKIMPDGSKTFPSRRPWMISH
ncbi:FmdB family zinc ribbon protein [Acidithiobacillus caldus]|uniref:FmdB family zinc ribbon protein n=1 Tax=Acidithiobacillus caldus TaxID=33059 RepID=UPI001C075CED|nr:zinc ribbon domain-containing protein [Acidithiobacillus caldus]